MKVLYGDLLSDTEEELSLPFPASHTRNDAYSTDLDAGGVGTGKEGQDAAVSATSRGGARRQDTYRDKLQNHVLIMRERQKLGSSATLARGAFLFSLAELCTTLTKDTEKLILQSAGDPAGVVAYISRCVWEGLSPPQEIWTALTSIIRHMGPPLGPCCNMDNTVREHRQNLKGSGRPGKLLDMVERRSSGTPCGAAEMPSPPDPHRRSCWSCWSCCGCGSCWSLSSSDTFWQIKVSLTLTICALFPMWPYLRNTFRPAVWIPVTATFVMADKRSSAVATCLLRLVGTVLGAVYGILAAKLSGSMDKNPYSWWAHVALLPWVAVTCFFRNSHSFGYAALVAAFTAVLMFVGSTPVLGADGEAISLARIVNTVVGIFIYLTVDTLLVPTRAKGLLREQIYLALDAALNEVRVNGERLFDNNVYPEGNPDQPGHPEHPGHPRHPRHFAKLPRSSPAPDLFVDPEVRREPERTRPYEDINEAVQAQHHVQVCTLTQQRYCEDPSHEVLKVDTVAECSVEKNATELRPRGSYVYSGDGDGGGGDDDGGGGDDDGEGGDDDGEGALVTTKVKKPQPRFLPERHYVQDSQDSQDAQDLQNVTSGAKVCHTRIAALEEGSLGRRASRAVLKISSKHGSKLDDEFLQKLVDALALQKDYLPLAELEPQLWFQPFFPSAYQRMVAAQEEVLRALTLMSSAAISTSRANCRLWSDQLGDVGGHLATLVRLLETGLEQARGVFEGDGDEKGPTGGYADSFLAGDGDDDALGVPGSGQDKIGARNTRREIRLLELQAEAMRLEAKVNTGFVAFIQAFLERGTFPDLELRSILRLNAAIIAVMGMEKALLTLGHAVATVLDRESFVFYYR